MTSAGASSPLDPEPEPVPAGRTVRRSARRARRRRFAWALVAYGSIGLLLAAVGVYLVVRSLPVLGAIDRQRAEIVRWLDVSADSIGDVQQGATHAGASLASAAASARSAASLSDDLSGTMASLRDTSTSLTFLGSRPLEAMTADFDRLAGRTRDLASSMTALAGSLDGNTADFATVAADAATLRLQVTELRDLVAGDGTESLDGSLGRLVVLVLVLLLWLALPAVASLVAGTLMLREADRARGAPAVPPPG